MRLPKRVHGDWPIGHTTVAEPGEYDAYLNPHGAISVIAGNGKLLGIKPGEFEWVGDLSHWAIYDHPKDYPNNYVVRRWQLGIHGGPVPDQECSLAGSLDEARKLIPVGLVRIPPLPGEDPVIVETWV